jgi:hypothetical protein
MSARPELKEWTVMFYLATDNPLAPGVISHLKAMKNAGYHPQVNVLAQFDPHGGNLPVHIFDVNRMEKLQNPNRVNIGFGPNDSYVRNMVVDKLWDAKGNQRIKKAVAKNVRYSAPIPSKTMASDNDPERSLSLFLDFCHRRYPARHYMLFVLGHGLIVAGDVFLFDENGKARNGSSGPRSLTLKQLGNVLDGFNKKIKRQGELELIGFHSCSMSGAEVAFELKNKANYMLAAQGPAYVGIWPYRQVLIRLFNDLGRSGFSKDDLKTNDLIDRLKQSGQGPTFDYIRQQFQGNGIGRLLKRHVPGTEPKKPLLEAVARKLDGVLSNPGLFNDFEPEHPMPYGVNKLLSVHERKPLHDEYLKWLNRQLLMGGLTKTDRTGYTRSNIKNLILSIFYYCYFNGLDFQLAGYSCDLTLCDLRQVDKLEEPVAKLVTAMTKSLKAASAADDPLIRDLLVLAHWESQSFYDEKYTDLYDFCFCLYRRCEKTPKSHPMFGSIQKIMSACDAVMDNLKRGVPGNDEGIIVRCEPCGPAYQYAHGFSVYFPWAEPVANQTWRFEYRRFKFARATKWQRFLKTYFHETMRNTQEDEKDRRDAYPTPRSLDGDMLDLLEDMSTTGIFNDDGQLTKVGSKDPLGGGKSGSLDPTGSDCDCGSIKNYPMISHSRHKRRYKGQRVINNVFRSYEVTFPPRTRR